MSGGPVARTDYYDDPEAPTPSSVVPAAVGCITNEQGRILLEHRVDNNLWALPGGTHDFGESIAETVVREIREETGLHVEVTWLVGLDTDPKHVIAYTDGVGAAAVHARLRVPGGRRDAGEGL